LKIVLTTSRKLDGKGAPAEINKKCVMMQKIQKTSE